MRQTRKNTSPLPSENKKTRILVGISGGVDSSVSALLLKEQGHEVEGVFAKVWQPDFVECTWRDEMKDAMRVCAKLEIPFHFLDLEEEYEKHVGEYMISEYQSGRTPNPDVMCNTHIKFGFIYDFAMKNGFDYVATGHYADVIEGQLYRGADTNKDQSYFLWNVDSEKFSKILFPIGRMEKDEVRAIAKRHGLFTSEKKDSQGLCFIGPVDMKSFLKKLIDTKPGDVIDVSGTVIGSHEGSHLYTIGERHGFTLTPEYKSVNDKTLFVIGKNIEKNTLLVSHEAPDISAVRLADVRLHDSGVPGPVSVQFRYRQKPMDAMLVKEGDTFRLEFNGEKPLFVADGQSAVLYSGMHCLGGGIVQEVVY